jgi:hypothetical protein
MNNGRHLLWVRLAHGAALQELAFLAAIGAAALKLPSLNKCLRPLLLGFSLGVQGAHQKFTFMRI